MTIRVVTDSSADLPPQLAQRWNITVVPCNVVVGDVNYKDGVDIDTDEFYRRLASSPQLPTTAQPSAADFQAVYRDLVGQGHSILSIHLSGKLSGTLNSAEQARGSLDDAAAVQVIDSQLASIPMGLVVLSAAELAQETGSLQEVAGQVRRDLPLTHCFFLLDTLEYLQKGGRIGKAQAFLGAVLSVKPILGLRDGEVLPIARPRTRDRGMRQLLELAQGMAPVRQLAVIYSTDPQWAEELRQGLTGLLPADRIITARFGATLGTYIGPNAVGLALTQAL
jgi:DegV family protein with EDD domain